MLFLHQYSHIKIATYSKNNQTHICVFSFFFLTFANYKAQIQIIMKKLILFAVIFTVSCSSSDDGLNFNTPNNQQKITPPQWLQGEWVTYEDSNPLSGYRITDKDVCHIWDFINDYKSCEYEFILELNQMGQVSKVVQNITENSYYLEIRETSQDTYDFKKISNNLMEVRNGTKSDPYKKYKRKQ